MPATLEAAAVTDGYRRRLIGLRDMSALDVAALLEGVDLDVGSAGLSRELRQWLAKAVAIAGTAATEAASLSATYLAAYLVASGARPPAVPIRPAVPDLRDMARVRPALLWRLGQGSGRVMAMRTATATARRTTREVVGRAAIQTVSEGIRAEPQFTGWRRVTSPSCCKRCAVQSGKTFRTNQGFLRHPGCRCTHEGIVLGRAETVRRRPPTVVAP